MDRDAQIEELIRNQIDKVAAERGRLGYQIGSPGDAHLQGVDAGLRMALAFVSPNPSR